MNDKILDFLKTRVGLFQHLSANRLAEIVRGSKLMSYEPNMDCLMSIMRRRASAVMDFTGVPTHMSVLKLLNIYSGE